MITKIVTKKRDSIIPKKNEFFEEFPKSIELWERMGTIHDKIVGHWKIKGWHKKNIILIERSGRKIE